MKERPYRYFTVKKTLIFIPIVQDLVLGCNLTYHHSIKMASLKVNASDEEKVWNNLYVTGLSAKHIKPKLNPSDGVRLSEAMRPFILPSSLYDPDLPYCSDGKLTFPLCRKCNRTGQLKLQTE